MRGFGCANVAGVLLVGAACAGAALAAPPSVTAPEKVYGETGDWVFFTVTTDGKGVKFVPLDAGLSLFPQGKLRDPNETAARATKPGSYRVLVYSGNADGPSEPRVVLVVFGQPGPAPPEPKPPDPKPPEPVKSFRVIFVYETANALTPAMQRVMFGEAVRNYLDAKTTAHPQGGKGWRRFDKDVDARNERDPALKALWADARPQVSAVPCVIVAVNDKADIVPFPADEAAALELFKKYAEGK
jgi:hypothetical protein